MSEIYLRDGMHPANRSDEYGYGSDHNWKQLKSPRQDHTSEWICQDCGEWFFHRYWIVPDIFTALKRSGVQENCQELKKKKRPLHCLDAAKRYLKGQLPIDN